MSGVSTSPITSMILTERFEGGGLRWNQDQLPIDDRLLEGVRLLCGDLCGLPSDGNRARPLSLRFDDSRWISFSKVVSVVSICPCLYLRCLNGSLDCHSLSDFCRNFLQWMVPRMNVSSSESQFKLDKLFARKARRRR